MFESIIASVVNWLDGIMGPLLAVVGVGGVLYCAAHVVKFINAEGRDREKAKSSLITAIVGSVLVFAVVLVLKLLMPGVVEWASGSAAAISE